MYSGRRYDRLVLGAVLVAAVLLGGVTLIGSATGSTTGLQSEDDHLNGTGVTEETLENVSGGLPGAGTAENPHIIENATELQAISIEPDAHYVLGNDIDANLSIYWNETSHFPRYGFRPIDHFSGSLDGQNHTIEHLVISGYFNRTGVFGNTTGTITNLTIKNPRIYRTGANNLDQLPTGALAGSNHGQIRNVTVVNGSVRNFGFVGGLVGENVGGTISNSAIRNVTVRSESLGPLFWKTGTGGLVGIDDNGSISNVRVESTVLSPNTSVGGLIGVSIGSEIDNTTVNGTVSGSHSGGILGIGVGSTLNQVTSVGSIEGDEHAGGIAGVLVGGDIRNVASTPSVTADDTAGGIVGVFESEFRHPITRDEFVADAPTIKSSYAATSTTGERVGGVAGNINTTISESIFESVYWDSMKGSDVGVPGEENLSITPLSTGEMTGESAATAMSMLDFETIWTTTETYPALRGQTRAIDADIATGELEAALVRIGKSATLLLQLTNPSDQRQIYQSDVRFGQEVVGSLTATLDAGEEREVEFDWNVTGVRTAPVTVGGVSVGSLTVVENTTVTLESVDSPEQVAVGEEYLVTATVRNNVSGPLEIPITHRTGTSESTERFVLEPGENSITFPTSSDDAGTVHHEVSFLDATVETNTTVLEPARFGIANIEAPETVEIDESFEVTVTIHNDGGFDGEKSVSIGPSGAPYLAESVSLGPGGETELTATGTAPESGNLEIVVETPDETESVEVSVEENSPSSQNGDSGTDADEDGVGFGLLTAALCLVTIAVVARRYGR